MQNEAPNTGEITPPDVLHTFVDEAGDPVLFNAKGGLLIGQNGCSQYFIIGKLEVDEPKDLSAKLAALRLKLLADPYFSGVESFKPERRKTAIGFHAKDDVPEVRQHVFQLLREAGTALRFHAIVCDKQVLFESEQAKRAKLPGYRYNPDSIYDSLIQTLFAKLHRLADAYTVCVAKRGTKNRDHAIKQAIARAETDFQGQFGFARGTSEDWRIRVAESVSEPCLQAADYFLWAVQRFYEERRDPESGKLKPREDRYFNTVWPQIGEIHDLDFGEEGTYFNEKTPLTLAVRFPPQKIKKPQI